MAWPFYVKLGIRMVKKIILVTAILLVLSRPGFVQPERQKIIQGNRLYEEERYDEALNKYIDAQTQAPNSPVIKFNMGNAQYKKNKYEEALQEYESTLTADDVLLQSQTYYNMGNSLYRMGKLPESILMYKKALELNPEDEDAKYNLEFVRKQLKDQANKQQQNQEQNQQQQEQQQQQNQDNDSQQQQEEQEQQQQQEQDQQQEQNQEQQDEQHDQQQEQQQQAAEELSKEDAERILNVLKENEQDIKDARKVKAPPGISVLKDW